MNRKQWTTIQTDKLRQYYPTSTAEELKAIFPDRSFGALRVKANKIGLNKTPQTKSRIYRSDVPKDYKTLIPTELAYMAGLFDGEGCITASLEKNGVVRFQLSVVNTNKHVIQWFRTKIGGTIYTKKRTNPNWRTTYSWVLSGNVRVANFLKIIYEYLLIKKPQAEMVINGYLQFENLPERKNFVTKLQSLNH